ncbi:MAG: Mur ligase domain-containing protein, partial [Bacteroidota bacterium]
MKNYQYVYFIGIGGIGMSALARWFSAQCKSVFGYDRTATALTHQLSQEGIAIHFEDQIEAIPQEILQHKDQSLVVYTPAITSHNQVLRYLTDHGYTLHKRAAVLGMISQHHLTLAVAGTHGKTITSSLAAHILHNAGRDMVAFVGGIVQGHAS